jgi:hypothetical protein
VAPKVKIGFFMVVGLYSTDIELTAKFPSALARGS